MKDLALTILFISGFWFTLYWFAPDIAGVIDHLWSIDQAIDNAWAEELGYWNESTH